MIQHLYSSLVELKNNVHQLQSGDCCETLGYYTVMDGGRAKYLIKQDETSVSDNGYIIRLSNVLVAILIIENNEINALQFGAHKNWTQYPNEPLPENWNSYDNKAIFGYLMQRASELSCNVYIPAGLYMCIPTKQSDILLPMCSDITLRGDGAKTIITLPTIDESLAQPFYSPILTCNSISNFVIENITFDGNRHLKPDGTFFGGNGYFGVFGADIWFIQNGTFENVCCRNSMYVGFRIWSVNRLNFNFCSSINVDCGFETLGNLDISNLVINNSYIDGHDMSEGISLFHTGFGENILITNNIIKNKKNGIGILVGNQTYTPDSTSVLNNNVVISGNIIENCAVGISTMYSSHININGNIIGNSISGNSMDVIHCKDLIISHNQLYYGCNDNIKISYSKHVLIDSNIIKDNSPTHQEPNNYFGFINLLENSNISIRNNQIYQELTSVSKCIRINTNNDKIVFESNEVYHDYRDNAITDDALTVVWVDGNDELDSVRRSYIELPPYTSYYTTYPPAMDDSINHSNVLFRRIDEINYIHNNDKNELARCCIIDVMEEAIDSIALKPINTRILLIFRTYRSYNTELRTGGNIHFSEYCQIEKDVECIIELVCLGSYWMEISRTMYTVSHSIK